MNQTAPQINKSVNNGSAMNIVFIVLLGGALLCGAATNEMKAVGDASFEAAKSAVSLAISLIGIMALWLGFMRVLEAGGLMDWLAKAIRPVMQWLFPQVPSNHPAMSAMILNLSANMLGLGNAATPFGIKAMVELNRLNPIPGTATNAMCLFLAINTSSITVLPLGTIGVRAAAGSLNPASIFIPSLIATMCSTVVAIIVAFAYAKRDRAYSLDCAAASNSSVDDCKVDDHSAGKTIDETSDVAKTYEHLLGHSSLGQRVLAKSAVVLFFIFLCVHLFRAEHVGQFVSRELFGHWLMPMLMIGILCYGVTRGVRIYEAVTEGAKQGFDLAVRIIPYLVAILVAVAVFRASGAMNYVSYVLAPITELIGMPPEVLPMALVRPLSGSGAFAIMSAMVQEAPNSYNAFLASVIMGCTETTFYVLAVYCGAVGVSKVRHAVVAALCADVAGITSACVISKLWWVWVVNV